MLKGKNVIAEEEYFNWYHFTKPCFIFYDFLSVYTLDYEIYINT